jgi:tetratricopeptide (TPR) repeat protein
MSQPRPLPELLLEIDQLAAQQQFNQASAVFKEIFERFPGEPSALRKLAQLLFQLGQPDAAISMIADALDPENPDAESVLALAQFLRALDRLSEAADLLYATALRCPTHPGLGEPTLELLTQLDRHAEAEEIRALLLS